MVCSKRHHSMPQKKRVGLSGGLSGGPYVTSLCPWARVNKNKDEDGIEEARIHHNSCGCQASRKRKVQPAVFQVSDTSIPSKLLDHHHLHSLLETHALIP
eukprot:1156099-Pelagomonas_calceolata.AAC.2